MAEMWSHDRGARNRLAMPGRRHQALKVHASVAAAIRMQVEMRRGERM